MSEPGKSCVEPAAGPIEVEDTSSGTEEHQPSKERPLMTAQVGKPAPDFEANAFVDGSFQPIRLSNFLGKWVVLCFYPGDFTFV